MVGKSRRLLVAGSMVHSETRPLLLRPALRVSKPPPSDCGYVEASAKPAIRLASLSCTAGQVLLMLGVLPENA